jgi:hypothetical protein
MKAQGIRLFDVIYLGPFMIYFGAAAKNMPLWARGVMIISGVGTILYNARNYAEAERAAPSAGAAPL